jgi:uncharacterized protein (TIGR02246 family)
MTSTLPGAVRQEDAAAVREVIQKVVVSWRDQNAAKMAEVYAEDATIVLPGAYLKGRTAIAQAMAAQFQGKWKGTQVLGNPLELRYLGEDTILLVSEGGAYPPGASEVPLEHAIRGFWFFVKRDGQWLVHAYGNTPAQQTFPLPA